MKRILLCAILFLMCLHGYAQNTIFGFWGGVGASPNYSYDVGLAGGFTFLKQTRSRTGIGADLFYQGYAFKYDREANGLKNGAGSAGMMILNRSSYIFLTPKLTELFGKYHTLEAHLTFGAGFKMAGTETMRKWDRTHGFDPGDFDSTIDTSPNINSLVFRFGLGLTEYIYLGKKWWFTVTEDVGFIPSSLTKSSDVHNPSRTAYSPAGKLNPFFISVHVGLRHLKNMGSYIPPNKRSRLGY